MPIGIGFVEEALAAEQARLRMLASLPPAMLRKVQELREKNPELLALIERTQGINLSSGLPALERRTRREPARRSLNIRQLELHDREPVRKRRYSETFEAFKVTPARRPVVRDSDVFEAARSKPKAGLGIAKSTPVVTAPGWNEGGSSFGDLRPRKSPYSGAVLQSRRPRRIKVELCGGGGPVPDVLDLMLVAATLNVIDGTDNVIDGTDNVVD